MVKSSIEINHALLKIVDEVIVNAIDHSIRQLTLKESSQDATLCLVKNIRINVDMKTGVIECTNDGDGIECEKHSEHGIYITEMIFGHLLTSTNYDDNENRIVGGTFGIGVKLANIFSKFFEVETVDHKKKLLYKQTWKDNMTIIQPPTISKFTKKPYTTIRFLPDYKRFGFETLTKDMFNVIERRAYDACAVTNTDVNIYFNDARLEYKSFEKYADLFLGPKDTHERIYEKINDRWEVIASYNDFAGFEQISFVNGVNTLKGGKHVDYILNQIIKKLTDLITKKKKQAIIKPSSIKDNLILFVKSTITNPVFDSQTKDTLTSPFAKFGSKAEPSDKFIEKLFKTELTNKVLQVCNTQLEKEAKKTDGKKTSTVRGIPNLDDANWAGTAKSSMCTLILTEGLSAKTMAISGLAVIGRDKYGVFPLRGKLLNVKDAPPKKILENEEISNLKKILGLEAGKIYNSTKELRYGKILILADMDLDSQHIRALILNMFHTLWPTLIINNGFIETMLTPIIRATRNNELQLFYSFVKFTQWRINSDEAKQKGWNFKYLKGLGSSKEKEAKEYFKQMKCLTYNHTGESSDQALDLAFNKKRSDDRKVWLENYDKTDILDYDITNVTIEDFINRDLIHYSNYDVERSIPNLVDGLKVSQRKILFGCLKRNLYDELKVAQLSGAIAHVSAYFHGEQSLNLAIIGMAQDFVGSNNLNLLKPNGQFGTRVEMGKDHASERYIFTHLFDIVKFIYRKEDFPLLTYREDDGFPIEPEFYVPIVPMILFNNAIGIGTGFSTSIPSYNPIDVINDLRSKLNGSEERVKLVPWFRGFTGSIVEIDKNKFMSVGRAVVETPTTIRITELPIGTSISEFKNDLEKFCDSCPQVKTFESHYKPRQVDFLIICCDSQAVEAFMTIDPSTGFPHLYSALKLTTTRNLSTTNMHLFNDKLQIKKYTSPHEIIDIFYTVRLQFYDKRLALEKQTINDDISILEAKLKFINGIINDDIVIFRKNKKEIEAQLLERQFIKKDDSFDYLLKLPVYTFTSNTILELESELEKTRAKLLSLINTTSIELWKKELDEFEYAYKQYLIDWENECNENEPGKTKRIVRKLKPKS
jgi:DNA topoisomerase-2